VGQSLVSPKDAAWQHRAIRPNLVNQSKHICIALYVANESGFNAIRRSSSCTYSVVHYNVSRLFF